MYIKAALAFGTALALGACAPTPEQFESTPVLVETAQGTVTCQLYTLSQVTWDRSIHRPASMDVRTADTICRNEGQRIMDGGTPVLAPTVAAL
ncbi:MAG: hypothetical protein Q4F71_09825 [Paracoccus sp. (in: a-proteobacteria)]|nr:hypothetical protein [Paracoccus sp. (in: a-proteobacteria)]